LRDCLRSGRSSSLPSSRWLHTSASVLAASLPPLGCLLHLSPRSAGGVPELPAVGVLAECAELVPLLRTRWLRIASAVTVDGPREWIECIDAGGRPQGRLYLLPDTDYLGWDTLLAGDSAQAGPPGAERCAPFCAWQARPLHFTHRRLGGLTSLGCVAPARISALGRHVAHEIARAEAVVLQL
jgi:hypothetical protein